MSAFMRIGRSEHDALTPGSDTTSTLATTSGTCADARAFGDMGTTQSVSVDETGFWSFTLSEPTALTITATNSDADPTITLFDATETTIAENDDFDGLDSRIEQTDPLPAGDYCLSVGAINDTALPIDIAIGAYDPEAALALLFDKGEAAPPLDGRIPFTALGTLDTRMRNDIQVGQTAQWYTVYIPQNGLLLVEAIAAGDNGDPWLVLYDDFGRQIGMNDDAGDALNSLLTARVQTGTYLVGVKQVGDSAQGFIRLLMEHYVPAQ
jgi:hypothetical protein